MDRMETLTATLIDGSAIAAAVRLEVKEAVDAWTAQGNRAPVLKVVLIGEDPASASYVRGKNRACLEAGIGSETLTFGSDMSEDALLTLIADMNADSGVDGILIQLPLPGHIDEQKVLRAISPAKDVDCFHPENVGNLVAGVPGLQPATPAGIMEMLKRSEIQTRGKTAVVIGRSNIVGKPMANLLVQKGIDATVTVCHSRTPDLAAVCRRADILVAAIGRPGFVTADMVKPGAAVIDVGINRVEDASAPRGYRLVGDVDFEAVREVAGWITPVPRGVGPMTIAMLLKNTLYAATGSWS
ncbi:MAG: methylenetetrahydrofolate dehydrogenase (NADP+)/methenyltetrahydrofolate cyclohydrolase [Rhodothermales bacterium]|jgi:methylenetetrahydrofolate dehydrogenase (NADP+)/methenyltetrahydrofolate cyclohydrolase